MQNLGSKVKKAIVQPYKIPGYIKRQVEQVLNTVEGSRIAWPAAGRALLETFQTQRPRGDELLVLTHATLVSPGTERAMFAKLPNTSVHYPFYPGYSGAGEVLMVGEGVTRFKVGDRVAAGTGFFHASLNTFRENQVLPIPDGVSMDAACFLQLGIIALQGVRKAQIQPGEHVAILGPGLLGQLSLQLAAAAGAYPITVIASSGRRLPLAREHGAHAVLNLAEEHETVGQIRADVTLEVTGNPEAIHEAIRCTRPGGRLVLLGSNRGITRNVDFERIQQAGLTLIGAHIMGLPQVDRWAGWWPERLEAEVIMQFLADGRLRVERLITDQVDPVEPELFYRRLVQSEADILGAVYRWEQVPERRRFAAPRREALEQGRLRDVVRNNPASNGHPTAAPQTPARIEAVSGTLRIGLIGCGEIAVENAKAIQVAPNAAMTMVMDVNPAVAEDMARRYQLPFTTSADELLSQPDIDAVLISVPHFLHAPLTLQAARYGKHVMVEKPMATTLADAEAMLAACREAGVKLSVVYCQRYLPYVQKARSIIQQGALGRLLGLTLIHYLDKPVSYWTGGRTGRVATDWRFSKEKGGGGILVFNLVHYLDLIHYITGLEATRAYSEYGIFNSPSTVETEDTISVSLRYRQPQDVGADQLIGNVTGASCVRGAVMAHQQLRIWGTEGQLIVGEPFQFYSLHRVDHYNPGEWHTLMDWEWGIERREYVQHFAQAVLRGEEPPVSPAESCAVQAVVEAIYASQESGHPIEIEAMRHAI